MDVVSLFAIVVFAASWWFWSRTPAEDPLVRLFFGTLMLFSAGAGLLGLLMRWMVD